MASQKALNPPVGECRQCWFHAYASKEAHKGLKWNEDCAACLSHLGGCPDSMIVKAA
ncbi:pRL2-8 [Streptomyces sp. BH097]|uniref:pRL2-8 n=1 Tax=Streptomyces sp. BH097 TaxID=3410406 RepID=UPI003CFB2AA9